MIYHVLTGDALLNSFPKGKLVGTLVIIRECLIEGPVNGNSVTDFFEQRKVYLNNAYPESSIDYDDDVVFEFQKLNNLDDGDELNFWFEHDLFCQVNYWFTLSLLPQRKLNLFRVSPIVQNHEWLWHGFGPMTPKELLHCFKNKTRLTEKELVLGKNLWKAYSTADMGQLSTLSNIDSPCFPYLKDVCTAQIERIVTNGDPARPERVLKQIIAEGNTDFEDVFQIFSEQEGIYGFGDSQVKKIYDQLIA